MKVKELWEKINRENAEMLCYLYDRWQDEKKYEDIKDYLEYAQRDIPEAFKISKRPFGITCKCDDGMLRVTIKRKNEDYLDISGEMIIKG